MTPKLPYTIGIDGGGTRCRGRLRNINGKILAEEEAGSANVHLNFSDSITTIKILIGNKADLLQNKKPLVNKVEAMNLARKYGMEYFETSSIGEASIV